VLAQSVVDAGYRETRALERQSGWPFFVTTLPGTAVNPNDQRPVLALAWQVEIEFLAIMAVRDIFYVSRNTHTIWQCWRLAESERRWQRGNKNGGDGGS
jgi:hypothetical protein